VHHFGIGFDNNHEISLSKWKGLIDGFNGIKYQHGLQHAVQDRMQPRLMGLRLLPRGLELNPEQFPIRKHHDPIGRSAPPDELNFETFPAELRNATDEMAFDRGFSHRRTRRSNITQ
jgi:hypothetical protein